MRTPLPDCIARLRAVLSWWGPRSDWSAGSRLPRSCVPTWKTFSRLKWLNAMGDWGRRSSQRTKPGRGRIPKVSCHRNHKKFAFGNITSENAAQTRFKHGNENDPMQLMPVKGGRRALGLCVRIIPTYTLGSMVGDSLTGASGKCLHGGFFIAFLTVIQMH